MAEKNVAALLDQDAYTIHVRYQHTNTEDTTWTYINNIPGVDVGDWVVVPTKDRTKPLAKYRDNDYDTLGSGVTPELRKAASDMRNAGNRLTIAQVVQRDASVELEPEDPVEYSWVIQKVDLLPWSTLMDRNKEVTSAVQEAYKQHMRRSFAERVLGELTGPAKDKVLALLNK